MALLRDDAANAIADMPVTLIVKRPDGTEFTRYILTLGASGALHQAIDLPKSSRRGLWSAVAYIDPKGSPVGKVDFSVQDFVPEKLKVQLSSDASILYTGRTNGFDVQADFLYGAPASGLGIEGEVTIAKAAERPGYPGYSFGLDPSEPGDDEAERERDPAQHHQR